MEGLFDLRQQKYRCSAASLSYVRGPTTKGAHPRQDHHGSTTYIKNLECSRLVCSPKGWKATNDVHSGDTSNSPLVLRHQENLLALFRHVFGVHRDLLVLVRVDVGV